MMSVLAKPGSPSSSTCPPLTSPDKIRRNNKSWPTTTVCTSEKIDSTSCCINQAPQFFEKALPGFLIRLVKGEFNQIASFQQKNNPLDFLGRSRPRKLIANLARGQRFRIEPIGSVNDFIDQFRKPGH